VKISVIRGRCRKKIYLCSVKCSFKKVKIDVVSELERLYSLVEKGILTQEEFEIQKKKIIV